jgi:hypothetical protein
MPGRGTAPMRQPGWVWHLSATRVPVCGALGRTLGSPIQGSARWGTEAGFDIRPVTDGRWRVNLSRGGGVLMVVILAVVAALFVIAWIGLEGRFGQHP